jgi:glycosyltransferase involved in cell wall biosynthesis
MSVLEAMAFRPVIGGNIGGIPEQIRDNVDGYLVEPGDSDALAQLMDKLAADPQRARRMGMNARQRLEEKYDLARHMQVLQALYQQLVGDKMKPK